MTRWRLDRSRRDDPATPSGRARRTVPVALALALLAILAVSVTSIGLPTSVAADDRPTLSFTPKDVSIAPGQEVVVEIIQNASVPTTGAQTNVTFEQKLVQLK